jgi:SAM-dependent methyltransferase
MSINTSKELFKLYLDQAKNMSFSGWDFSYVTETGRMVESPLKWNYYNVVLPWVRKVSTMLDMGTGGGEVLSRFKPLPQITYATEQYKPNIPVARERLESLGVKVVQIDEKHPNNEVLPFEDNTFDLIINKHEAYYPQELMRILKPGGLFITQQVGQGLWNIKKYLTGQEGFKTDWHLETLVRGLELAGFQILSAREDNRSITFYDIGAIVYWLKAIPWIIEDAIGVQDFTVEKYKDRLWELHLEIEKNGFYDCSQAIFIIMAQKR